MVMRMLALLAPIDFVAQLLLKLFSPDTVNYVVWPLIQIGLVVTIGRCLAAGEGGGLYYIAWGAIVFGCIQFFRGLSQSNNSSS